MTAPLNVGLRWRNVWGRAVLAWGALAGTMTRAASVEVYLIGGQSNATGQGYVKNLPPDFAPLPTVGIYHSGAPHLNGVGAPDTWHALAPAAESPDRFGPELSFGNRLQALRPEVRIALIKHAHSGTSLFAQWSPGASGADRSDWGEQYAIFVTTVEGGLAALRACGDEPVIKGMIWHQGEADADAGGAAADNYAVNLAHFVARVRAQFHVPAMPFVYALITRPEEKGEARDTVRQAQRDCDAASGDLRAIRGACMIDTDDLPRRADDPDTPYPHDREHIGSAGMLTEGRRMAEAMAARLTAPARR